MVMSAGVSSAAPAVPMTLPHSVANDAITKNVIPAHIRGPRHNCRRHGRCGGGFHFGGGGVYIGPGFYNYHGSYTRSCRRVRRWCRREWGGGRRYRRCVRRRDCRV